MAGGLALFPAVAVRLGSYRVLFVLVVTGAFRQSCCLILDAKQPIEADGGATTLLVKHVAVALHGEGRIGVTDAVCDGAGIEATFDQQRHVQVA